jgi:hypothetical protein
VKTLNSLSVIMSAFDNVLRTERQCTAFSHAFLDRLYNRQRHKLCNYPRLRKECRGWHTVFHPAISASSTTARTATTRFRRIKTSLSNLDLPSQRCSSESKSKTAEIDRESPFPDCSADPLSSKMARQKPKTIPANFNRMTASEKGARRHCV